MRHRAFAFIAALAIAMTLGSAAVAEGPWPDKARPLVRFIDEAWNRGDYAAMPDLFTADAALSYRGHAFPGTAAQVTDTVKRWRTGFPDFHFTIEDMLVDGDKVAVRLTFTGTNLGPFWGPATGRHISVAQMLICRLKDGRIGACWEDYDEYGMRQQLGLIPRPTGPAS